MESQLWNLLYHLLETLGHLHCRGKKQFSDAVIVGVLLWAGWHDRPICWACQLENWQDHCPWLELPSGSTMSRRLRSVGVLLLLEQLAAGLREHLPGHMAKIIDSKPLPVDACTKDRDAKRGYAAGEMAKGYKIHAILDAGGALEA